jgi:hypothetical protein
LIDGDQDISRVLRGASDFLAGTPPTTQWSGRNSVNQIEVFGLSSAGDRGL